MTKVYRLTKDEQETVIRASAADQEWDVWTCDPRFVRYLRRQGYEPQTDHQSKDTVSCRVLCRRLRISKCADLTAEQRANLAIRLKSTPRNRAVGATKL